MENSNEKKYDISKSNFFANIPEKNDEEKKNEIKEQSPQIIQTPLSNMNPQIPQNSFSYNNNINNNNINNIPNANISYANSNFFPSQNISTSNYYSPYQINNQYQNNQIPNLNYQNNLNYAYQMQNQTSSPTPSPSFFQKVSESAMNLIKKEDPLNLITDINP